MIHPYFLAIGWTLAILAACSIPGNDIPKISFNLFEPDKIAHFILFCTFGWLWLNAIPETTRYRYFWISLSGIFYAIFTEIYQGMLPFDRTPDPMDSVANIIGLFAALGSYRWLRSKISFLLPKKA